MSVAFMLHVQLFKHISDFVDTFWDVQLFAKSKEW